MKILLAEDDALTRFMMSEMLEELDLEFDTCADGAQCVDLVQTNPDVYGLILMDIHMPNRTGIEAMNLIRGAYAHPPRDIPIVAVTADQSWQDSKRVKDAGFTDVLSKPVSFVGLEDQLLRYSPKS
jgi:CheY-like chemotaxis protein